MKHVCHLVILVFSFYAFASDSQGQEKDKGAGGAALSISANVKPASIIALSTNSKNAQVSETKSTSVGIVRFTLQNPGNSDSADIVKQTQDGTMFLNRIEILVRFSGFKQETATVLITITGVDDSTSGQAFREGASPESSKRILAKQIVEVRGVKSGARVVRYVGFLIGGDIGAVAEKTPLGAVLRYEIAHP